MSGYRLTFKVLKDVTIKGRKFVARQDYTPTLEEAEEIGANALIEAGVLKENSKFTQYSNSLKKEAEGKGVESQKATSKKSANKTDKKK